MYWELIVPTTSHLLFTPGHYTNEVSWARDGWLWRRQPALTDRDLEELLQVSPDTFPTGQANRYLFSTVGRVTPLEVWMAPRSGLVFISSFAVLAIGLTFIYFPVIRHPAAILVLALLVVAGAVISPEATLIIVQSSLLGAILVIVAAYLARRALNSQPAVQPSRGSSFAMLDRSTTAVFKRIEGRPQPSTATAPMAVQSSTESTQ
jgi:hypothetical protein